jgi:hypothetical protein
MPKAGIRPVPCVSPVHALKIPIARSGIYPTRSKSVGCKRMRVDGAIGRAVVPSLAAVMASNQRAGFDADEELSFVDGIDSDPADMMCVRLGREAPSRGRRQRSQATTFVPGSGAIARPKNPARRRTSVDCALRAVCCCDRYRRDACVGNAATGGNPGLANWA